MVLVIFGGSAMAGSAAQAASVQSILDCTKITNDMSRLACFDVASKKLMGSTAGSDAGGIMHEAAQPTKEEKIADFGKNQLRNSIVKEVRKKEKEEEKKELTEITLKVMKYQYTVTKKFVLFMENGQIWKQKDGNRIRLPKGEFNVIIKKGMLSGYNMIVPTKRSLVKVKRLK